MIGAHDRSPLPVAQHVPDERLVDLERVDVEPLEIAEVREPRAEVVDRERHAHQRAAGGSSRRTRSTWVTSIDSVISSSSASADSPERCEDPLDDVGEVAPHELHARDVHRQLQRRLALALPPPRLAAGLVEDPLADGHDETALLGDRDEARRAGSARAPGWSSAGAPRRRSRDGWPARRWAGSRSTAPCAPARPAARSRARGRRPRWPW